MLTEARRSRGEHHFRGLNNAPIGLLYDTVSLFLVLYGSLIFSINCIQIRVNTKRGDSWAANSLGVNVQTYTLFSTKAT